ncbi:MAG: hypothetical protein IPJ77_13650 [Planctomycetes bacterium]|nr:hypothetical protein [Planctomycetota bacterium]
MNAALDPAAAELLQRIAVARRVRAAALVVECGLVGLAAGLVTATAARFAGRAELGPVLGAATLSALAAGLAWWVERAPDTRTLVHQLDARGAHHGALFTAWECAQRASGVGGLGPVLVARVLPAVRGSAAWRPCLRVRAAILAGVCAAIGLCAWAYEQPHAAPQPGWDVLARAADGVQRAAPSAAAARPAAAASMEDLARRARALAEQRLARPADGEPAVGELEALAAAAEAIEPGSEDARSALEAFGSVVDQRLAEARGSLAIAPPRLGPSGSGERPSGAVGAAGGGLLDASGPEQRGAGAAEGTASASVTSALAPLPRTEPSQGPPSSAPSEPAVRADGPWWAPRYDAVVSRWIEVRRGPR